MKYRVYILDVNDADAIVIKYTKDNERWINAVIDAGNIGDGIKVKQCIGKSQDGKYHIDYAICTHPDKDHKGGFFDMLNDNEVDISNISVMDPWEYLEKGDFTKVRYRENAKNKARSPFNSPDCSSKNLIDIAEAKGILQRVHDGYQFPNIPLLVIGPKEDYYKQCVLGMVEHFAELKDEPDMERFDESAFPSEEEARSVIDEVEDESYTNKSSMVLLFRPNEKMKFLLCGDAASSSLQSIVDNHIDIIKGCIIKVPHHGSKHNLTTSIIDRLSPISAVISARGTKKHPNKAIVRWLSKYCDVFSTHKSGTLIYKSEPSASPAIPLKEKSS